MAEVKAGDIYLYFILSCYDATGEHSAGLSLVSVLRLACSTFSRSLSSFCSTNRRLMDKSGFTGNRPCLAPHSSNTSNKHCSESDLKTYKGKQQSIAVWTKRQEFDTILARLPGGQDWFRWQLTLVAWYPYPATTPKFAGQNQILRLVSDCHKWSQMVADGLYSS